MPTPTMSGKAAFSIDQFCSAYGVGRTTAYKEIAAGRLTVAHVGRRTLVPLAAAEAWLADHCTKPARAG